IVDRTGDAADRELLRLYWYDGAINKVPTPEQKRVGLLPSVKLRLGRIVGGHQKGVDSLIVLDLLKLAGTGMVDLIYLLSGDDDLTEGVREAQACGVRVVLLGAATSVPRQSEAMVLEADGVDLWPTHVWAPHFTRLATVEAPVATALDPGSVGEAVLTFERVGYAFSARWLQEAQADDVARVRRSRPRIPADVDARLLWDTSAGRDLSEGERVALRDGFWRALDERADPGSGTSTGLRPGALRGHAYEGDDDEEDQPYEDDQYEHVEDDLDDDVDDDTDDDTDDDLDDDTDGGPGDDGR